MANAFFIQGTGCFLSLALGLLLPGLMREADLGQYLLANTVIQTGALLAMLGTRQTVERNFGLLRRESDKSAGVFLSSMLTGRFLSTIGAAALSLGLAYSFRSAGLATGLYGFLVALVVLRSVGDMPFHVSLSCGDTSAGAWAQTLRNGLRFPAVLLGYRLGGLLGIFSGLLTSEIGLAAYGWKKAWPELRWHWRGLAPRELRGHWAFARSIALYSLLVIGINQLGPWAVGWLPSTTAAQIDFNMAWQLGLQFLHVHYIAQQAAIPRLSVTYERGSRREFFAAIDGQARATWVFCSTFVGCAALTCVPLIALAFGPARRGLGAPLTTSFVAVSAWAMASVFSHGLFAAGRGAPTVFLHGAMFGAAGILGVAFAPRYGTSALPGIYAAVCFFGWALAVGFYSNLLKCPFTRSTLVRILASGISGLAAFYFCHGWSLPRSLPFFLTVHTAVLAATGLLWDSERTPLKKWLFAT